VRVCVCACVCGTGVSARCKRSPRCCPTPA
jgi:hypothetical protein